MKVSAEKIFSTAQYENIKIHLEDDVKTEESTEQVMLRLVENLKLESVEKAAHAAPKPQAPTPAVKPAPQPQTPNTTCPRCGKTKKETYEICYLCFMDTKGDGQQ